MRMVAATGRLFGDESACFRRFLFNTPPSPPSWSSGAPEAGLRRRHARCRPCTCRARSAASPAARKRVKEEALKQRRWLAAVKSEGDGAADCAGGRGGTRGRGRAGAGRGCGGLPRAAGVIIGGREPRRGSRAVGRRGKPRRPRSCFRPGHALRTRQNRRRARLRPGPRAGGGRPGVGAAAAFGGRRRRTRRVGAACPQLAAPRWPRASRGSGARREAREQHMPVAAPASARGRRSCRAAKAPGGPSSRWSPAGPPARVGSARCTTCKGWCHCHPCTVGLWSRRRRCRAVNGAARRRVCGTAAFGAAAGSACCFAWRVGAEGPRAASPPQRTGCRVEGQSRRGARCGEAAARAAA